MCVHGDGQATLPVLVLGEAPGRQEDDKNQVFVGQAGRLLRSALVDVGLNPHKLWLTNAAKCYPQGTPTPDEISVCSGVFLRREFETLKPKWCLTLGRSALSALRPDLQSITQVRGKLYLSKKFGMESFLFPTYHPAYILRQRGGHRERDWRNDLEMFAQLVQLDLGDGK